MAIQLNLKEFDYSISKFFINVTVVLELTDTDILDSTTNQPKVLDEKVINITQNFKDPNILQNLFTEIETQVINYLQRVKLNFSLLDTMFGTHDPDQIKSNVSDQISQNLPTWTDSVFNPTTTTT